MCANLSVEASDLFLLCSIGGLEEFGVLVQWERQEVGVLPQIGGEVCVSFSDGEESGLGKISQCLGFSGGGRVNVLETGVAEELGWNGGGDETGSAGSRDQAHAHGTTLSGDLARDGVRVAHLVSPVSPAHGDDGELGENDCGADGGGDFLGALDAEANVAVVVSDDDKGLESGALAGLGLLLDWHDLENLVLQSIAQEGVDDFGLLHRDGCHVYVLEGTDEAGLDETAELGDGAPVLKGGLVITTATATATTATTASTTSTTAARAGSESALRRHYGAEG